MLNEPKCYTRHCKHYQGSKWFGDEESSEKNYCAAFPEGIPNEIAYGDNLHTSPYIGDHGIRFEAFEIGD